MIYLENTTQSQQVYIPRQIIQTATTREINNITSGDVINIVDEKLEPYYTSAETDTQIENAVAAESARCEETYAKIEDIPDVSDFVTSADVKTQVEDYNYVNSADVKTQIEDYHYITSGDLPDVSEFITSGQAQEQINQSLSGFASEEYVDNAVGGAIDYVDDQFSSYSQEFTGYLAEKQDKTAMTAYYTSAETDTAIENAIAAEVERADSTYATPSDIPDVSEFITSADVKNVFVNFDVTSGDSSIGSYIRYAKLGGGYEGRIFGRYINGEPIISDQPLTNLQLPTSADVETQITNKNYITSADATTQIEGYNYVNSGDVETQLGGYDEYAHQVFAEKTEIPDVSNFVTSADVETQIDGNLSAYTPTSNFATINGSAITEGGNIIIQGGSGGNANIIELTQAEYNALTAYTEDALYVITDAEEVDLNDYATSADLATKVDKINVSASSVGYFFPKWNTQGQITGSTTVYSKPMSINGSSKTLFSPFNESMPTIYAPSTAGDSGQVVVSNGSGAPSWSSFKFWYGSQLDYDLIYPKDNSTIYFITD